MLGVLINSATILLGGALGLLLGKRIPQRVRDTIMQGLSLCVIVIGLTSALKTGDPLALIVSLVLGGLIGGWIDIESRFTRFANSMETRFTHGSGDGKLAQGFVSASLLFCVGAMAVVGSLESGLNGNHTTLIAKAALDGVASVFFAAALGPGVLLSAVSILLYQGLIALSAGIVAPILTTAAVLEMSAVGGTIIMAIGLNMLGVSKVSIGNLLPAVFIPLLYVPIAILL